MQNDNTYKNLFENGIVAGGTSTLNALVIGADNVSAVNSLGMRNRIINGNFIVDEHNYGGVVTSGYPADRWLINFAGSGAANFQRNFGTSPIGNVFDGSVKVTITTADTSIAAGDVYVLDQNIEGMMLADALWGSANAKAITVSFYVRSNLTGTYSASIGCVGSITRGYAFTYTIDAANTWEKKTVTIPGDTGGTWTAVTSSYARLRFCLGAGTNYTATAGSWTTATSQVCGATGTTNLYATVNNTWELAQVQLEIGSVATPFEFRPYERERTLCSRYFQRIPDVIMQGVCTGATTFTRCGTVLPVEMRSAPVATVAGTLTIFDGGSAAAVTTFSTWFTTPQTIELDGTCSAGAFTAGRPALMYTNGSGSVKLNAEIT